ncbi:MAG: hypothetical protein NTW04_04705, partial [Elusimicrobia bacterium]|nr:hypothetical protein [Elusimicrobiota bacterium]
MQKKWVYLNTAIFFMAVALVPSAVFVDAFNNYFGFLNAWSGGSSRSFKAEQLPPQLPKITFVKFSIRIPKAKIVGLSADFNKWQAGLLPLAKKNGNVWETTIPLPKGTSLLIIIPLNCFAAGKVAVLFIPHPELDVSKTLTEISMRADFKVTLAMSAETLSKKEKDILSKLTESGRVEVALRINGDPVLPALFAANNPSVLWQGKPESGLPSDRQDEMAARIFCAIGKSSAAVFGGVKGFVPSGGGIIENIIAPIKSYGLKWAATGRSSSTDAVLESGGVSLIAFSQVKDMAEFNALVYSSTQAVFAVIDQTTVKYSTETFKFSDIINFDEVRDVEWTTVSALAEAAEKKPLSENGFPKPWTDGYTLWFGLPQQLNALNMLGKAREAFTIYRTGISAERQAVSQTEEIFTKLESGSVFTNLADPVLADETEQDFKTSIGHIYALMGKSAPSYLFAPMSSSALSVQEGRELSAKPSSIKSGQNFIAIENPQKKLRLPDKMPQLPAGISPEAVFSVSSIRILWDGSKLEFRIKNPLLPPSQISMAGKYSLI